MKQIPILFSGPMVKAILDGSKTQTRRVIKSRHESGLFQVSRRVSDNQIINIESLDWDERDCEKDITCPYGQPGDVLWVRETYFKDGDEYIYRADGTCCEQFEQCECEDVGKPKWKPSIFMPREACRILLKITDVRAERLHEISKEDAISEGITISENLRNGWPMHKGILENSIPDTIEQLAFWNLWQDINGSESLESNPWCWVVSFEKTEKP